MHEIRVTVAHYDLTDVPSGDIVVYRRGLAACIRLGELEITLTPGQAIVLSHHLHAVLTSGRRSHDEAGAGNAG